MDRQIVNPWTWQDTFGFVQANLLQGVQRTLVCAGQTAADADGNLLYPDDMGKQITQAFDNLETVLKQAGFGLAEVVRLNYYTTDVDGFIAAAGVFGPRLAAAGCRPASTLLGVSRLAFPGQVVELEATAVA
ncbi:MAG TPA: RidA family protein [Dehalococcoidia bacterium]|nr:RidA family protein [Dehalococcoidia bacterium]